MRHAVPLLAALEYAAAGIPVLPLHTAVAGGSCSCGAARCDRAGKHPRWRPGLITSGLREASTDPVRLCRWWSVWPAANIGLRTGVVVDVCDIDTPAGLHRVRELLGGALAGLPAVRTGSGGVHLYLAATGMTNRVGLLPGVDWRGVGGYVVAPPSRHASGARYGWVRSFERTPASCPAELLRLLAPRPVRPRAPITSLRNPSRYAVVALDREAGRVRSAPVGQRNNTLYRATRRLGELAAVGLLSEPEIAVALLRAGRAAGLGPAEVARTIRSGLHAARPAA